MKIITNIFICLALLWVVMACKSKENEPTPAGEPMAVVVDESEYNRIMQTRPAESRLFEIKNAKREDNILKIWVNGGCNKNNYKVVWDGFIRKTYPLTLFLVVTLEKSTEIECMAQMDYLLEIDLRKMFGGLYDTSEVHVKLSNGSKIYDKIIDPKGAVTNR